MSKPKDKIDHLIINSPFEEPKHYWKRRKEDSKFEKEEGRRPAGYYIASPGSTHPNDPGIFVEIPLVMKIRPRVQKWKEQGYPGVTGITKRLLEHWYETEEREGKQFFFCQLEAIETLIWLTEAPDAEKVGIDIPSDGGDFQRICSKMATGTGKTVVMAMLIAWQAFNKVTYQRDTRFAKNFLVIAPGLTIKSRLEVLQPSAKNNYYHEFNVVPAGLFEKLRQAKILIHNWHVLDWETAEQIEKKRTVDKRGPKSDEAYAREILRDLSKTQNIVIINDEAHHAWRIPAESKIKGVKKEEIEEATKWIGGLDRIHKARSILTSYDFSATPFAPTGKRNKEEALFNWIVSDFGLNDAIESGLVKTPRVVIRDDGELGPDYKSRLYHIYADPDVKDDLTRKADEHEPLPDLVINAYYLLGKDWRETYKKWQRADKKVPPVMITVTNRTETAARVKYAFDHRKIRIDQLCVPEKTLHIDSKVLEKAEARQEPILDQAIETGDIEDVESGEDLTKKEQSELLRQIVDTVGQVGKPGEQVQNVISVQMLSEGWDAKTVTHIMGLRAFSSQLLCEQTVGRGLRRTTYEINKDSGMFSPEYVNIFGVPFTFLPHESTNAEPPPPPPPKTLIEPDPEKKKYKIEWPNIIRIDHVYNPQLTLDLAKVKPLEINAYKTRTLAELAPTVAGKTDVTKISQIKLDDLAKEMRMQRIIFETARDIYDNMQPNWQGNKQYLLSQLISIVENFLNSDKIQITPPMFYQNEDKKRILLTLNMQKVVQHIWEAIRFENTEALEPVFDPDFPIRSTGDMRSWYTGRPCEYTTRSHINYCVFDKKWEASEAFELDRNAKVEAWVKNDHLGFQILYVYKGVVRKYWPDFLIRLTGGKMLVLETKGQDTQRDKTKREFLQEWVKAVNEHGGFGKWEWVVSFNPADLPQILEGKNK